MKKIIIAMPVANEEDTIEYTIKLIRELYPDLYLYLVMDNYSTDNTEKIIKKLIDDKVKLIFYADSTGVASCYLEGIRQALQDGANHVIEMDAGGSHDPKQIQEYLEMIDKGYDCVFGSRFMRGGREKDVLWYRRLISRCGTLLGNFVFRTHYSDISSGFNAFSKDILQSFDFSKFLAKTHMHNPEMKYYCRNSRFIEVPIVYTGSKSCFRIKTLFRALGILFRLKRNEERVIKK